MPGLWAIHAPCAALSSAQRGRRKPPCRVPMQLAPAGHPRPLDRTRCSDSQWVWEAQLLQVCTTQTPAQVTGLAPGPATPLLSSNATALPEDTTATTEGGNTRIRPQETPRGTMAFPRERLAAKLATALPRGFQRTRKGVGGSTHLGDHKSSCGTCENLPAAQPARVDAPVDPDGGFWTRPLRQARSRPRRSPRRLTRGAHRE